MLTLARLARRWDLGELVASPTPLAEGTMNRNWRLETSAGVWFAKQYLDADAEQVTLQHQATRALAAQDLPVLAPLGLPGAPEETFVIERDGRPVTVYPWVHGQHRHGLELTLAACEHLGSVLGRLHHGLSAVMRPVQQTFLVDTPHATDTLALVEKLLGLIQAKPDRDGFDALAAARLVERRVLLRALAGRRPSESVILTTGWTHGDFHGLNLLYAPDGLEPVAILDWDRLSVQPYAYELARAATLLFGYGDDRGLDLARVRRFVRGYQRVMGLEPAEVVEVANRLWWVRLNDLWMLQWHYQRGDTTCDHLFAGAASLVAWWTEHRQDVEAAFGSP